MDFLADWFNLSNLLYLIILIMGVVLTMVANKYRVVVVEIRELFEVVRVAYEDDKVTAAEKDKIMKEVLDVLRAILGVIWSPFRPQK